MGIFQLWETTKEGIRSRKAQRHASKQFPASNYRCPHCSTANSLSIDGWYFCKKCHIPFNTTDLYQSRDHQLWVPLIRLVGKLSAIDGDCDDIEEKKLTTFIEETFYQDPHNDYLSHLVKAIFTGAQEESDHNAQEEIEQLSTLTFLTKKEKYALIKLLVDVALSDNIYHKYEKELLENVVSVWGCQFLEDGKTPTLHYYLTQSNWAQLTPTIPYKRVTLPEAKELITQEGLTDELRAVCQRVIDKQTELDWDATTIKSLFISLIKKSFNNRETPIPHVSQQPLTLNNQTLTPDLLVPLQKQIPIFINQNISVTQTELVVPIEITLSNEKPARIESHSPTSFTVYARSKKDLQKGLVHLQKIIRELFFSLQNHFDTDITIPKNAPSLFLTPAISIDGHLRINSIYQKDAHEIQGVMKEFNQHKAINPQLASALMQYYAIISNDNHLLSNVVEEQRVIQAELEAQHYSAAILHSGRCAEAVVYNLKKAWNVSLKKEAFKALMDTEKKWHELLNLLSGDSLSSQSSQDREKRLLKWSGEFNQSFYFLVKRWEEYQSEESDDESTTTSSEDSKASDIILLKSIEHKLKSKMSSEELKNKGPKIAELIKRLEIVWKNEIKKSRDRAAHAPFDISTRKYHTFTLDDYHKVEQGLIHFISIVVELYNVANPQQYRTIETEVLHEE